MSLVNDTKLQPAVFFLSGIPELEDVHVWIAIPFFLIYTATILGNLVIFLIIKTDLSLHEPMYIFLSMLAATDLGLSISTMPTAMGIFFFNSREISHDACFAQIFFISSLTFTQSSVLSSMAFDRFVAICNPLRYTSILTPSRIAKMGLVSVLRGLFLALPLPILLKRYRYCQDNILSHSYCIHKQVMMMACSESTVSSIYGFFITLSSLGLDLLFILLSYAMILKTILSTPSHTKHFKALNTCVSHIFVVLLSYVPGIGLSVIYRFVKNSSPLIQNVLGNVFLLIPPLMNPIVYSMKSKLIRERIKRVLVKLRVSLSPAAQNQASASGFLLSTLPTALHTAPGQQRIFWSG